MTQNCPQPRTSEIAKYFLAHAVPVSPAVSQLGEGGAHYRSIMELERLVGSDPEFSLRVLALANSAFYSRLHQIDSVRTALVVLGDKMVQRLAAGVLASAFMSGADPATLAIRNHSIAVGVAARLLSETHRQVMPERAYTAGLLHDIGRLAMLRFSPEKYAQVWPEQIASAADEQLEQQVFGVTHTQLGAEIADLMRLPGDLAAAIGAHGNAAILERTPNPLNITIFIANQLAARCGYEIDAKAAAQLGYPGYLEQLGLIDEDIDALCECLPDHVEAETAMLSAAECMQ